MDSNYYYYKYNKYNIYTGPPILDINYTDNTRTAKKPLGQSVWNSGPTDNTRTAKKPQSIWNSGPPKLDINILLHNAAEKGNDVAVVNLLKQGDVNAKNGGGKTPLHSAAEKGRDTTVTLLLEKGADIHAQTRMERLLCIRQHTMERTQL
jgi:ankyrin repeat protein